MKEFPFLLYKTEKEDISINALIKDDSIWLTQKAMAELFGIDKSGISRHLANIFETGELESKPRLKDVVCSEAISLCYWPAPQGAGFHFVQATMPLTRCSP